MRTSNEGKAHIERWEGRRHTAYQDTAGNATIGVGHLIRPSEDWLRTATLTDAQVDELFDMDLRVAEAAVQRQFPNVVRQNQFDALVSFTFNLGEGRVDAGSLDELVNSGATAEAIAAKWKEYRISGGQVTLGLVNRRASELKLYFAHLWRTAVVLLVVASVLLVGAGIATLKA